MTAQPQAQTSAPEKILVIKLGALGDFMLALGAMQAIRQQHPGAHITLLTSRPFVDIAHRSRCFNEIMIDVRPKFYQLGAWFHLGRQLNKGAFTRVYDLQMNDRTALYFRLFARKPEWSGTAPGCSHPYVDPPGVQAHAFYRHRARLKNIGIDAGLPDLSFMYTDVSTAFPLKKPYVLLVPGSAPTRPEKRWPAAKYGALAKKLHWHGYDIAVLGTAAEQDVISRIIKVCPEAHDLGGRTSFYDIASLAANAAGAVGNDTGPTHIISLTGCPVTALFSGASDPARCAPIGDSVTILQSEDLMDLSLTDVMNNFNPRKP